MEEKLLPVSEIFSSIQGEGIWAGKPAQFLRLAYCNLTCTWCDSIYTWKAPVEVEWKSEEEIFQQIRNFPPKHLVITGGEPLLFQSRLIPLLKLLQGYFIEVETNATIVPDSEILPLVHQFNVSPKLANSGVPLQKRFLPEVLHFFSHLPKAYFKYVVCQPEDIEEIAEQVRQFRIPKNRVILMPEGKTREQVLSRREWVLKLATQKGFRFTDRWHILLWNGVRGK
ncbi:MAG: 7-carboxy-7-deazaguanine synthase QueE [bacterium JZ-2024 1]